jgi:hypothetical protein
MSLFSTASAQPYSNNSQSDSMSSQSSSDMSQGTYQRGSYREITPNAGPRVAHGADVFITADFIWWKAVQEGTEYASTGVGLATNANLISVSKGRAISAGRDWAPGFKVGLGLNLNHDGWDIYAQYTWLHPSNSNSISRTYNAATASRVIGKNSLLLPDSGAQPLDRASANWSLNFNVIDLELGRNFYVSQFLTMRPFIGLKGTWQDQDLRTRYYSSNGFNLDGDDALFLDGPYRVHQHTDVWGLGIRGGFNISWYMAKNWSIFGNMAWTAMWTDYTEISRKDTIDNPTAQGNGNPLIQMNENMDDHYSVKWIGEIELGLRWEIWFYDDNYHFAIQAGWEEQVWLNWNLLNTRWDPDHWEDLNFHGLNLKFRFDF